MFTKDFLGNTWEVDCLGCAIARQELQVPAGLIRRTGYFCVHQDPLIPLAGFLVIASLRHIHSLSEMTAAEYVDFSMLVRDTHAAIKKAIQVEFLTLIQEEHSVHFHLWFFPWLPEIIQKYGEPSLTTIRAIMGDYSRQPIRSLEWEKLQKTIESLKLLMSDDYPA